MEHDALGGPNSSFHSKRCQMLQAEYSRQQKYLDKCGSYTSRAMEKEEGLVRRQFDRIEKERKRIQDEKSRTSLMKNSGISIRDSSTNDLKRSSHRVVLGQSSGSVKASMRDFERSQTRSKKHLIEDGGMIDLSGESSRRSESKIRPRMTEAVQAPTQSATASDTGKHKVAFKLKDDKENVVLPKIEVHKQHPTQERKMSLQADDKTHHGLGAGGHTGHASYDQLVSFMQSLDSSQGQHDDSQDQGHDLGRYKILLDPNKRSKCQDRTSKSGILARSAREKEKEHESMNNLLDAAIQTISAADDTEFTSPVPDVRRMSLQTLGKRTDANYPNVKSIDSETLHELEDILQQTKHFKDRKETESDGGVLTTANRAQRKRLNRLEELMLDLSKDAHTKFNPREMLDCGYLRLSSRNINTLEGLLKDMGIDPGIHAHSDVTDYDLFGEVRKEKEAEEQARRAKLKEEAGRRSRLHSRRDSLPSRQGHGSRQTSNHSKTDVKRGEKHSHGHQNNQTNNSIEISQEHKHQTDGDIGQGHYLEHRAIGSQSYEGEVLDNDLHNSQQVLSVH